MDKGFKDKLREYITEKRARGIIRKHCLPRDTLMYRGLFIENKPCGAPGDLRNDSSENAWASLCENKTKEYTKSYPGGCGRGHIMVIRPAEPMQFYDMHLNELTCIFKNDIKGFTQIWQKNELLFDYYDLLSDENIFGLYDERTEEYWLRCGKYNIMEVRALSE